MFKGVASVPIASLPEPHRDQQRSRQPQNSWEIVALDLMGPYPRSSRRKTFLLVVTELFSRWVEAFPLGNANAPQLITIVEREEFSRYGYPRDLLTDNGTQFTGKTWLQVCER